MAIDGLRGEFSARCLRPGFGWNEGRLGRHASKCHRSATRFHARTHTPTRTFFDSTTLVCSTERFPSPLVSLFSIRQEERDRRIENWMAPVSREGAAGRAGAGPEPSACYY